MESSEPSESESNEAMMDEVESEFELETLRGSNASRRDRQEEQEGARTSKLVRYLIFLFGRTQEIKIGSAPSTLTVA